MQCLGLSSDYKDKNSDLRHWISFFYGMAFLSAVETEDCFVEDIMSVAPEDVKCQMFADYVLDI